MTPVMRAAIKAIHNPGKHHRQSEAHHLTYAERKQYNATFLRLAAKV